MKFKILFFFILFTNISFSQEINLNYLIELNDGSLNDFDTKLVIKNYQFLDDLDDNDKKIIRYVGGYYSEDKLILTDLSKIIYKKPYDKYSHGIIYTTEDKNFYVDIKNQASMSGFKLTKEDIIDSKISFTFVKNNYELDIIQMKELHENDKDDIAKDVKHKYIIILKRMLKNN